MAEYRNSRKEKRNRERLRQERRPLCWLCTEPIDYEAPKEDPLSFSADHRKPWSTHPELREDYANLEAAHLGCNQSRGNRAAALSLGLRSRDW